MCITSFWDNISGRISQNCFPSKPTTSVSECPVSTLVSTCIQVKLTAFYVAATFLCAEYRTRADKFGRKDCPVTNSKPHKSLDFWEPKRANKQTHTFARFQMQQLFKELPSIVNKKKEKEEEKKVQNETKFPTISKVTVRQINDLLARTTRGRKKERKKESE